MEPETATPGAAHAARTAAVATIIGVDAFFDSLIVGVPLVALAIWLNPLIVFVAAAIGLTVLNIACCSWIERHWSSWIAGSGTRLESRLEKWRKRRLMRSPSAGARAARMAGTSWQATLANALIIAGLARLITGQPVPERRLRLGCLAYAIFVAAICSVTGFFLGDAIDAA